MDSGGSKEQGNHFMIATAFPDVMTYGVHAMTIVLLMHNVVPEQGGKVRATVVEGNHEM